MKITPMKRWIPAGLLPATLPCLPGSAADPAQIPASALRPFVDSNTRLGTVVLEWRQTGTN
jgi:hypothetical protein